jgi:hypothetical protein
MVQDLVYLAGSLLRLHSRCLLVIVFLFSHVLLNCFGNPISKTARDELERGYFLLN